MRAPELTIDYLETKQPIRFRDAKINVFIQGSTLEVRLRLAFQNPYDRKLEGELVIPLPETAVVCDFGKKSSENDSMLWASVVPKDVGRVAFEEEVRSGGKTATLVEQVRDSGNAYKTWLWPLPPNGLYEVELRYTDSIFGRGLSSHNGKESEWRSSGPLFSSLPDHLLGEICTYLDPKDLMELSRTCHRWNSLLSKAVLRLPLAFAGMADTLSVQVQSGHVSEDESNRPFNWTVPILGGNEEDQLPILPLTSSSEDGRGSVDVSKHALNCTLKHPRDVTISVALPSLLGGRSMTSVKRSEDGDAYFSILDCALTETSKKPPSEVDKDKKNVYGVVWDTSLSRDPNHETSGSAIQTEMDALRLWALTLPSGAKIQLMSLSHELEMIADNLSTDDLIPSVKALRYGGGSDMNALRSLNRSVDYWIVATDGVNTCGNNVNHPSDDVASVPLYILSAAQVKNAPYMKYLAASTGGQYFDMNARSPSSITNQIGTPNFGLARVEYDEHCLMDVEPSMPVPLVLNEDGASSGDRIQVSGKFQPNIREATVYLHYGYFGAKSPCLVRQFTIRAPNPSDNVLGTVVPRVWAAQQVQAIQMTEGNQSKCSEKLLDLGRRFHLVTPNTSLVVLEELEQFVKHHICPPKSRPDLRNAYLETRQKDAMNKTKEIERKLEVVCGMWKERAAWWNTTFGPETWSPPKPKQPSRNNIVLEQRVRLHEHASCNRRGGGARPAAKRKVRARAASREFAQAREPLAPRACAPPAAPALLCTRAPVDSTIDTVKIKPWDPNTPYLDSLKSILRDAAPSDSPESIIESITSSYENERKNHGSSPAFYFDVAAFFFETSKTREDQNWRSLFRRRALSVLMTVLDLGLEDPKLVRLAAYVLQVQGYLEMSARLFSSVMEQRPEEPQSHRDYAIVLSQLAENDFHKNKSNVDTSKLKDTIETSLLHFAKVVTGAWDSRFDEIEVTCLMELNAFLAKCRSVSWLTGDESFFKMIDMTTKEQVEERLPAELLINLDCDLRVSLAWDTDMTDIDLHVIEPTGEEAYYRNRKTRIGGLVSRDFTAGYGPEEYMIKQAMPGTYKVKAKYFASHRQDLAGATTLMLTLSKDFGRFEKERRMLTSVRLTKNKEMFDVGEFTVE